MVVAKAGPSKAARSQRGRRGWLIFLCTLLAASLVPYRSVVCPAWRVEVVGTNGKPRPSVKVTQDWTYYSLQSEPQTDVRMTDDRGEVVFPMRSVWASALRRALGAAWELARMGLNASFGPHASIFLSVKRPGEEGAAMVGLKEAVVRDGGEVFYREVVRDETPFERARRERTHPPTRGHPAVGAGDQDCEACHRSP